MEHKPPTYKTIGNEIVQWDIEFSPSRKASETLEFVRHDGVRLYVDVDKDNIPVAVEIVGTHLEQEGEAVDNADTQTTDRLHAMWFSFASQLVWIKGAIRSTMTDFTTDAPSYLRRQGSCLVDRSNRMTRLFQNGPDANQHLAASI